MWTAENRKRYDRSQLRYPSDLTDEEWQLIEPLIPPAKRGGRKREVNVREVAHRTAASLLKMGSSPLYRPHKGRAELEAACGLRW
jgi:transposase